MSNALANDYMASLFSGHGLSFFWSSHLDGSLPTSFPEH